LPDFLFIEVVAVFLLLHALNSPVIQILLLHQVRSLLSQHLALQLFLILLLAHHFVLLDLLPKNILLAGAQIHLLLLLLLVELLSQSFASLLAHLLILGLLVALLHFGLLDVVDMPPINELLSILPLLLIVQKSLLIRVERIIH